MSETSFRILLVEDNPPDADLIAEMLSGHDECFEVDQVDSLAEAERRLKQQPAVDIILLDLGLPDSVGLASLERVVCAASHLPVIVLTGLEDEALGLEAVRKGAQDYLVKGQTAPRMLAREVRHAIERKRLQESLRQLRDLAERRAAEAQAANEAKSRFLANVSHELRTPMNAILGMIELALRKDLDATTRDYLDTARESADVLLTLLNDLLDSAKVESGNLELEAAPLRLRRTLDQINRALSVRASEKGLAFVCRVPDNLPDVVLGDEVRLRQVLLNLAGNAIKFTPRGEVAVTVRVGSLTSEDVCLEFAVRDTGIGIPASDLERIFKPFIQADASTARRFGGTGLGLSISASLVALMGGRIWAESQPGQGSTFYFTVRLPLTAEMPAEQEPAPDVSLGPAKALRILLVEDNPANQKLATYILREGGHTIEVARDGREALRLTEESAYDVILMDVQMPGMDGLECAVAIRAREKDGRRVPIIAMTAHAMRGDRERCLAAGMDGYLSKPIDAAEMFAVIKHLAGNEVLAEAGSRVGTAVGAESSGQSAEVFDLPAALESCYQNRQMFGEMVGCLFEDAQCLFPQMQAALERQNLKELGDLGHRLKGTLVYLGARPAVDAARAVERCGDGGTREAVEAVKTLEQQIERLKQALTPYRQLSA